MLFVLVSCEGKYVCGEGWCGVAVWVVFCGWVWDWIVWFAVNLRWDVTECFCIQIVSYYELKPCGLNKQQEFCLFLSLSLSLSLVSFIVNLWPAHFHLTNLPLQLSSLFLCIFFCFLCFLAVLLTVFPSLSLSPLITFSLVLTFSLVSSIYATKQTSLTWQLAFHHCT